MVHIGIILDGNRRYAKCHGLSSLEGHLKGAENVSNLLKWCLELGVNELTLYCFSMQNFNRDSDEVSYLMKLFTNYFSKLLLLKELDKYDVKIKFAGRIDLLDDSLKSVISSLESKTSSHTGLILNFALAYGGREEIVDAVNKAVKLGSTVTEESFKELLYVKSYPDIIIRTGGDRRISNFLLWQSAYTELFFIDKFWPEFSKADLVSILDSFKNRERRFGC
ncbi:di-trans,poly-cis-decaprenylcistransferase [Candidatus Woesearchaeota archaeon]|nr:di-trans,poly-cis-decaprenylcistransferase [Candidatus Woesearchaeota archaeon]